MKIVPLVFSPTGGTKRAADLLSKELGETAHKIDLTDPTPQSTDLDDNTLALLDRNLATADDLIRIAGQFGTNATMLRIVADQGDKLAAGGDRRAQLLVAQIGVFLDPEARMEIFDGAMLNAHIGAGADLFHIAREAWNEHAYGRFKAEMQALDSFTFEG